MKNNHSGKFGCTLCNLKFLTLKISKTHYEDGHSNWEKSPNDSTVIETRSGSKEVDETTIQEDSTDQMHKPSNEVSEEDDELCCKFCKKRFSQASNIQRHIANVHGKSKRKANEMLSAPSPKIPKSMCNICEKSFRDSF